MNVLSDAFIAEGVDTHFTVMGNGNMWWSDALARKNVRTIHARHENCAIGMASGYARRTGKVGVASITSGPGLTQIATDLTIAARTRLPLVVYSADSPLHAAFATHRFDQAPLALSTGAHFVQVRTMDLVLNDVREAFYVARFERRPVVLAVPEDFQKVRYPHLFHYVPSTDCMPDDLPQVPHPDALARVADLLRNAERPILLAGRGAIAAAPDIVRLAERTGALLATTLQGKGMFDGHPYNIGISGAFASRLAREQFAQADAVVAIGAIMSHHTTEGGYLFPEATVAQIDKAPRGIWQAQRVADMHVRADATLAVQALLEAIPAKPVPSAFRSAELAAELAANVFDPKEYPVPAGTVDPRQILREIDRVVPKDWDIVCGIAHFFNFVASEMGGRPPERWHMVSEFAAIGSALGTAIGVAAARGDGKVLLIEGDGSMLMHIQELETVNRHGIRMLMCVMNDGAYAAEAHKFVAAGMDPKETVHGRSDFARIAQAFGLGGATIQAPGQAQQLLDAHLAGSTATVWDVRAADNIPSAQYRRLFFGEE